MWSRCLIALLGFIIVCQGFKNILELNGNNFHDEITSRGHVLVFFYAPWCEKYKKLLSEYEKAAEELKNNNPPITLATIGCSEANEKPFNEHFVLNFPTFKIFYNGVHITNYNGLRKAHYFIDYMKSFLKSASKKLETADELKVFLNNHDHVNVVGFFENDDSPLAAIFHTIVEHLKGASITRFAYTTSKDILNEERLKNKIVIYRPENLRQLLTPSKLIYSGRETIEDIKRFINQHSLVYVRTQQNMHRFKNPLIVFYYTPNLPEKMDFWRSRIAYVVDQFPQYTFAVSSKVEFEEELIDYGIQDPKSEKVIVFVHDQNNRRFMLDDVNQDVFLEFMENLQLGLLEPFQKSQLVPEDNSGSVKIAVANNFKEVVMNNGKDTLIHFYSPWSGHCEIIERVLEVLAEKLVDEDLEIVKFDSSANDVPEIFEVRGNPMLFWLPKNDKGSPIEYEGDWGIEDFIEFVAIHATEPLKGYDRDGYPIPIKKVEL